MPKVSVIIPNFNHACYLDVRLSSILDQTFQNFEIILLDDCSTDNSKDIIERYRNHPKISHINYNSINTGNTFKQWDAGIRKSNGEFIWIAESDDFCEKTFLENAVNSLDRNSNVGLVYCQSWKIDEFDTIKGSWLGWTKDLNDGLFQKDFAYNGVTFVENFLIHKNVIPNASAVVFRKNIYFNIDGVNYDIKYCGDWFLWLKIALVSDVAYISEPLNYFRCHQKSVIYKASQSLPDSVSYSERFDRTMRKIYSHWLKGHEGNINNIRVKNNLYISKEYLAEAKWHLNQNDRIHSVYAFLNYFILTKDFQFFVQAVYRKCRKLFNKLIYS